MHGFLFKKPDEVDFLNQNIINNLATVSDTTIDDIESETTQLIPLTDSGDGMYVYTIIIVTQLHDFIILKPRI